MPCIRLLVIITGVKHDAVCLCACVRPSVCPPFFSVTAERETWTCFQVGGMHGKLRFGAEKAGEAGEMDGC